ncbi:MAG: cysteine synthase A [Firmicutes bacterium]|nr:cysteine synthase A [Alicyclobacillaceae bacterium]MCL6496573.1 cysteine synthase A [Bacillota bacterium]
MAQLEALIGNTPLVRLDEISARFGAEVFAKLESFNPGGSIKDRTAWALIKDAQERGLIRPDTIIIEATSGNTGIALAMVCAILGLRLVVFMPEGQSLERRQLFWAYGATVVETPQAERTQGAIVRARALAARLPNGLMLRQHENPANPRIHEETTGPEIWRQMDGRVDVFIAGVGTGGTVTGVGRFLKRVQPAVEVVAVEPAASAVLSGKPAGPHKIQGIGAGFVPEVLDRSVIDQVVAVGDDEAWEACRALPRREGVLAGLSSGAVYRAAERLLAAGGYAGKRLALIFADSGERYLSTGIYQPTDNRWVLETGGDG